MERSLYLIVAVLQVLAFGTILCKVEVEREKRELSEDDLAVKKLFNLGEGHLAGEDTPVWFAGYSNEKKFPIYTRTSPGIIKRAMDHWADGKFKILPKRPRRSVDESPSNIVKNFKNWNNETLSKSSTTNVGKKTVEKRETKNDIYHISILVVMYYSTLTFPDKSSVYNTLLYALSFWNSVDLQLRHVKVRLRIAGIILAPNDKAVPYLEKNVNFQGLLRMQDAFDSMMKEWRYQRINDKDFRNNPFDIVATMTDYYAKDKTYGVFSDEPPCVGPHKPIAGHLIQDNLSFGGIQLAVHGIAQILGAKINSDCPAADGNVMPYNIGIVGREWSECTLQQISSTLRVKGSCLGESNAIKQPNGKPVEIILPANLISPEDICHSWDKPNVCRIGTQLSCAYLYCAGNNGLWNTCDPFSQTLDGSTCDEGKICLDEKCVTSEILYNRTDVLTPLVNVMTFVLGAG